MADTGSTRLAATLIALFAVGLFLWFLGSVAEIAVLLFISVLLGAYFSDITDTIVIHTRMLRGVALATAALATLLVVVGVGALVLPAVISQAQELLVNFPNYARELEAAVGRLAERYPVIGQAAFGSEGGYVEKLIQDAAGFVRGSAFPYLTAGGKLAVELFSVVAMALFLAREPRNYKEGLISLVPPRARHIARAMVTDLGNTIRAWITGQLLAMVVLAALTAVGLWALRVPYALAFAAFTGAAALVPFFGTIVSTLLPTLFVLVIGGWGKALAVALLGVGVHLVEANVLAPLIFQERIKLPPVLTIVSVLVMANILGVLGLIVAVPLLATTIVIVRHVLIGQIYGAFPAGTPTPAVLVPTQEHRRISLTGAGRVSAPAVPPPSDGREGRKVEYHDLEPREEEKVGSG